MLDLIFLHATPFNENYFEENNRDGTLYTNLKIPEIEPIDPISQAEKDAFIDFSEDIDYYKN